MGRGSRSKAREAEEARRNQLFGQLQREMRGIPKDLTPAQRAAIIQARLGGLDIGYGGLQDIATRRFARTGSQAGFGELLEELGRERAREKARAGAELESEFAEVPVRRRLARAGILQPMYAGSTGLYGQLLSGGGPSTVDRILGVAGEVGGAAIIA